MGEAIRDSEEHKTLLDFFEKETILLWAEEWIENGKRLQHLIKETEELFVRDLNNVNGLLQGHRNSESSKLNFRIEELEMEVKLRLFQGYFGHLAGAVQTGSETEVLNTLGTFEAFFGSEFASFEKKTQEIEEESILLSKEKKEKIRNALKEVSLQQVDTIKKIQAKTKMLDKLFRLYVEVNVYLSIIENFHMTFRGVKVEVARRAVTKEVFTQGVNWLKGITEKEIIQRRLFHSEFKDKIPEGCYKILNKTFEHVASILRSIEGALDSDCPFDASQIKEESDLMGIDFSEDSSVVSNNEEEEESKGKDKENKGTGEERSFKDKKPKSSWLSVRSGTERGNSPSFREPNDIRADSLRQVIEQSTAEFSRELGHIEKWYRSEEKEGKSAEVFRNLLMDSLRKMDFFQKYQEMLGVSLTEKARLMMEELNKNETKLMGLENMQKSLLYQISGTPAKKSEETMEEMKQKMKEMEREMEFMSEMKADLEEMRDAQGKSKEKEEKWIQEIMKGVEFVREIKSEEVAGFIESGGLAERLKGLGKENKELKEEKEKEMKRAKELHEQIESVKKGYEGLQGTIHELKEVIQRKTQEHSEEIQRMRRNQEETGKEMKQLNEKLEKALEENKEREEQLKRENEEINKKNEELAKEIEEVKSGLHFERMKSRDLIEENEKLKMASLENLRKIHELEENQKEAEKTMKEHLPLSGEVISSAKLNELEEGDISIMIEGPLNGFGLLLTSRRQKNQKEKTVYFVEKPPMGSLVQGICLVRVLSLKRLSLVEDEKELEGLLGLFDIDQSDSGVHLATVECLEWPMVLGDLKPK